MIVFVYLFNRGKCTVIIRMYSFLTIMLAKYAKEAISVSIYRFFPLNQTYYILCTESSYLLLVINGYENGYCNCVIYILKVCTIVCKNTEESCIRSFALHYVYGSTEVLGCLDPSPIWYYVELPLSLKRSIDAVTPLLYRGL